MKFYDKLELEVIKTDSYQRQTMLSRQAKERNDIRDSIGSLSKLIPPANTDIMVENLHSVYWQ